MAFHGSSIDVAPTGLTTPPGNRDQHDEPDELTAALARVAERFNFTPAA